MAHEKRRLPAFKSSCHTNADRKEYLETEHVIATICFLERVTALAGHGEEYDIFVKTILWCVTKMTSLIIAGLSLAGKFLNIFHIRHI